MRVIPVDHCKEGMVVAKPIVNKYGLSLVETNVSLTPALIETLKRRNVRVVYIKEENSKDVFNKLKKNAMKQWILFLISAFFIAFMCLKSIAANTQLVPVIYSNDYQLLTKILFFAVIVQQIIIALFKNKDFWNTLFQQIISFIFSYNILTLAILYFQSSVLKQPKWEYFYLLILFELFILTVILAAWKKT